MKKFILVASALLLTVSFANAQLKSSADVKKYVEAAKANSENPKKAEKAATWLKLGDAYFKAFTDATGGVQIGQGEMDASLFMQAKPSSQEVVSINGQSLVKVVYSTVNLYYQNGAIAAIEPTDLAYPDALSLAAQAYAKALTLDPKKDKEVIEKINTVNSRLNQSAVSWNTLGNQSLSSADFEKAYEASILVDGIEPDTAALYNAGLTAWLAQDLGRAEELFKKSLEIGYAAEGEVYAKLGDIYVKTEQPEAEKAILEEGFAKFPESQNILICLINYADRANEDPNYILSLLAKAKENDPTNASIYSVEGNMFAEMKRFDEAVEAYHKSTEVDPNYLYAYYAEGKMWYDHAVDIQGEIDALPWNAPAAQISKLDAELTSCLEKAIPPMETCFEKAEDLQYKVACADVLRRCYFSLRNVHEGYEAKAATYKEYVDANNE